MYFPICLSLRSGECLKKHFFAASLMGSVDEEEVIFKEMRCFASDK